MSKKQTPKGTKTMLEKIARGLGVMLSSHYCQGHDATHYYISFPGDPIPWCPLEAAKPGTAMPTLAPLAVVR